MTIRNRVMGQLASWPAWQSASDLPRADRAEPKIKYGLAQKRNFSIALVSLSAFTAVFYISFTAFYSITSKSESTERNGLCIPERYLGRLSQPAAGPGDLSPTTGPRIIGEEPALLSG